MQPPHRLSGPDDPYASSSYLPTHTPSDSQSRGSYIATMPAPGYNNMDTGESYSAPAYSSSQWLEKQQASSRKSKWIVSHASPRTLVFFERA